MNERIKLLAKQCWDERPEGQLHFDNEKFAALVEAAARADERKQCAKIARDIGNATEPDDWALDKCQEIEAAIRARGEQA